MSTFFNNTNLVLRYEPFPIGYLAPMVEPATYAEMLANWPAKELFEHIPRLGDKYTLSENCHSAEYHRFVRSMPVWSRFDAWIKGPDFIPEIMQTLLEHHIDLGFRPGVSRAKRTLKNVLAMLRGRSSHRGARHIATWAYQMMPAQGGHLLPHSDAPSKIVTMTLAMTDEGEWNPEWGGGIDINRAKSSRFGYNQLNRQAGFEDMDIVDTIDFTPNTGVIFIKTFNSWHSVRPMCATDPVAMRRNLIINIKTD